MSDGIDDRFDGLLWEPRQDVSPRCLLFNPRLDKVFYRSLELTGRNLLPKLFVKGHVGCFESQTDCTETGAIEKYGDFRRYPPDMECVWGMKSDVQSALEDVFEEHREMGVGLEEEGIVIEGEIPDPVSPVPVYDLL